MLSGTREKDTRKERSSSPREARSAPDRASARSGRGATVLTGSDVAPASVGKPHSRRFEGRDACSVGTRRKQQPAHESTQASRTRTLGLVASKWHTNV
jgi:hypothetical protein